MYNYSFLAHTADVSIMVKGDTLEELFLGSLLGMNQILKEGYCDQSYSPSLTQEISVRSVDTTTLLIDFLSAVLTHSYLEKVLFCEIEFEELTQNFIHANVKGSSVDFFEDDIKAVTYHGAEVVQCEDHSWATPIIFDI